MELTSIVGGLEDSRHHKHPSVGRAVRVGILLHPAGQKSSPVEVVHNPEERRRIAELEVGILADHSPGCILAVGRSLDCIPGVGIDCMDLT